MKNAEATQTGATRRSICMLTNAYPDFPESSRVVFLRSLAQLLGRNGWNVSVVAPRIFRGSKQRDREGEIEVRRFASFLNNRLLAEYQRAPAFRLLGYMASGLITTVRCLREHNCGLIHAHWVVPAGLIAIAAGRICRTPVIVTAHGSDLLVVPGKSRAIRLLVKYVLRRADAVTSVAEHLTDKIVEMGIPRAQVLTSPMSVPTESFCPSGDEYKGWGGEFVVFSNRSLYPLYNVETLVRAVPMIVQQVPHAEVVIAGEGPEERKLISLAVELGVTEHVKFVGMIPHSRMPEYLRGASIYVSTALSDGASVSLLEAMACGTFPIVADIPANREWIEHGRNGFLFSPEEPEALAEKIVECIAREDLRADTKEHNAQIIEQRARWSSNIEKLLALCERVTSR